MIAAVLEAGKRLAAALQAENAALLSLDLKALAQASVAKAQAAAAYEAARAAAAKLGAKVSGPQEERLLLQATKDLQAAAAENGRLLQATLKAQSRVIEIIAKAALPPLGTLPGRAYGPPASKMPMLPSRLAPEALALRVKA